ncbi:DUF5672 family protein (plasmid) [Novosphingobium sp. BL-8H]|uniref:DUF5672 family protein n=1 Tax=Novosphingobium sp. BL-8H TaxID=3127640 RepID=UPI003756ED55
MIAPSREERLELPQVTVCAVTSVNVKATLRALEASLAQIAFAECLLFTDADLLSGNPEIRIVPIERIGSSAAYSDFLLNQLVDHIETSHCLVVQWDGHVLDATRWKSAFLDYDYIGASWPQFDDGYDVGNGGFSLRTRRLMEACRAPEFRQIHPEDLAIGRGNRELLEGQGMRFPSRDLANSFAVERTGNLHECFGYHGVFNMPQALGVEAFWQIYGELDNWGTVHHDFKSIFQDVRLGPGGGARAIRLLKDRLGYALRKR